MTEQLKIGGRLLLWFVTTLILAGSTGITLGALDSLGTVGWRQKIAMTNEFVFLMGALWAISCTLFARNGNWPPAIKSVLFVFMWLGSFLFFYAQGISSLTTL